MQQPPLKIALVAGEASGDLLGAGLLSGLKALSSRPVQAYGIGGSRMLAEGFSSWYPIESLSVMGLVEVLKHYRRLSKMRQALIERLLADPPDVFIGIDAPDFTLFIEKRLKAAGIKTVHYVSPSVWAWRQKRIFGIKQSVDLMLTLFPFETDIYTQHAIPVRCVGHTLADKLPLHVDTPAAKKALGFAPEQPLGVLMPGSRTSEVQALSEVFLRTAARLFEQQPSLQFCIPLTRTAHVSHLQALLKAFPEDFQKAVNLTFGNSHQVMPAADWILIASGTATLEACLLKKPMVVAYRVHWLSYRIFKRLIKVPWVSLPNLLAQKNLVPECLQKEANPVRLQQEIDAWQGDAARLQAYQSECLSIHQALKKDANRTAAQAVLELLDGSV
jgi:lipid-A-disaccharide synthase